MTNAEIIAQIRTEIERLKNHAISSRTEFNNIGYTENAFVEDGRITVYNHLLSFLSDLEKSLPINSELRDARRSEEEYQKVADEMRKQIKDGEELNGEIDKFLNETGAPYYWCNDDEQKEWCTIIARHFYDLGCRRTAEKYDELEYNRQRAEESVPKNLEEAAVNIADELLAKPKDYALSAKADYWNGAHDGTIAGAKWQKWQDDKDLSEKIAAAYQLGLADKEKQMLKEAVEGEVFFNPYPTISLDDCKDYDFKDGDKVRIIVIPNTDEK